jgi:hypothetical protein
MASGVLALPDDYCPERREDGSDKNPQRQVPNGSLWFPDLTAIPTDPGCNNLQAALLLQLATLGSPGV